MKDGGMGVFCKVSGVFYLIVIIINKKCMGSCNSLPSFGLSALSPSLSVVPSFVQVFLKKFYEI